MSGAKRLVRAIAFVSALHVIAPWPALGCVAIDGKPCPRVSPWLVFFDWNSDQVPLERYDVIEQVVNWWKGGERGRSAADPAYPTKITVDGYSDGSLSPAEGFGLSARMAQHIADVLVKLGVDRNDILLTAHGEEDPRIPSEPGIREPQNRRVEIWFKDR